MPPPRLELVHPLTPRNSGSLLFDGIPWVARAQIEHDIFADALRSHGTEVLYLRDLLTEVLRIPGARAELTDAIAGLAHAELAGGRGLVHALGDPRDVVIDPLPNLLFTRDSSVWIGAQAAVTSLASPARAPGRAR